ncbi:MAG: TlpA disulfide reductase family protein [Verrucomicrobia bacterium]|nr:TlpA disulfide reductase family protein [Verrucomicrobiota bacterium]
MKKSFIKSTVFAAFVALLPMAFAAELGDPAPALQVAEWVKGQPVELAAGKGKNIFVVEFWATWCPPCRQSIPHLTELQKKFKDKNVVFVAVTDEQAPVVKEFVGKMGDKMDYTVAVDKDRKTAVAYLEAFGVGGIPHAFIVDKEGRIVWQGHPMADLEVALGQILDGKYDIASAKKRFRVRQLMEELYGLAGKDENRGQQDEIVKELQVLEKELGVLMPGKKFDADEIRKTARFNTLLRDYQKAISQNKSAAELEKLEKPLLEVAPKDFDPAEFKSGVQLQGIWQNYMQAVVEGRDEAMIAELTKQLEAVKVKSPVVLNELAWSLLTDQRIKKRDLKLALKFAQAASDACEGKEAAVLDTLARALFVNCKLQEAVAQQKKAVELSTDKEVRDGLERTLKEYEEKAKAGGK